MEIYGIEKLTLVDYDGHTACILFTGGCNFHCGYCHNSSLVETEKNYQRIPHDELFAYLKKRKGLLDGVAITGGEPTLNKDLPDFIKEIKDIGYDVKLDSNGTNPEMLISLANQKLVDYFAMDIKSIPQNYSEVVGKKLSDTVMNNLYRSVDFLKNSGVNYEFRTTLISQYHTKEVMLGIAEWIKGAKKYVLQRFINSESCLSSDGLTPIDKEVALEYKTMLSELLPNVLLRAY